MKAWGHATPKPTFVFSNTPAIGMLNPGKMSRASLATDVKTTRRYVSKAGKQRFAGTAQLKGTQLLSSAIGLVLCWITQPPNMYIKLLAFGIHKFLYIQRVSET